MYIPSLRKSLRFKTIKRIIIGIVLSFLFLTFTSCSTTNQILSNDLSKRTITLCHYDVACTITTTHDHYIINDWLYYLSISGLFDLVFLNDSLILHSSILFLSPESNIFGTFHPL